MSEQNSDVHTPFDLSVGNFDLSADEWHSGGAKVRLRYSVRLGLGGDLRLSDEKFLPPEQAEAFGFAVLRLARKVADPRPDDTPDPDALERQCAQMTFTGDMTPLRHAVWSTCQHIGIARRAERRAAELAAEVDRLKTALAIAAAPSGC